MLYKFCYISIYFDILCVYFSIFLCFDMFGSMSGCSNSLEPCSADASTAVGSDSAAGCEPDASGPGRPGRACRLVFLDIFCIYILYIVNICCIYPDIFQYISIYFVYILLFF